MSSTLTAPVLTRRGTPGQLVVVGFVLALPFGLVSVGPVHLVQVAAVGLVLGVWFLHASDDVSWSAVRHTAMLGGAMLVAAALATPFSQAPNATFRADFQLVLGVAVAMAVAAVCADRVDLARVLGALLVVGTAVAAYAILTAGHQEAVLGGGVVSGRATGPFVQPNELGAFLAAMFVLGLGALAWTSSRRTRYLALVAVAVIFVGLLMSLSRGAWMGAVLGSVVLLVAVPSIRRPLAVLLAAAAAVVAVVASVGSSPEVAVVGGRLATLGNPADNPYDNRAAIWAEAVRQIEWRPMLGNGPGSFPEVAARTTSTSQGLSAEHAHNLVLTSAAEYGLVGLAVLLVVGGCLATGAWRAVRALRASGRVHEAATCATLAGAMATLVGHGLVDYPLRNSLMYLTCWVLLGALVGATRLPYRKAGR